VPPTGRRGELYRGVGEGHEKARRTLAAERWPGGSLLHSVCAPGRQGIHVITCRGRRFSLGWSLPWLLCLVLSVCALRGAQKRVLYGHHASSKIIREQLACCAETYSQYLGGSEYHLRSFGERDWLRLQCCNVGRWSPRIVPRGPRTSSDLQAVRRVG